MKKSDCFAEMSNEKVMNACIRYLNVKDYYIAREDSNFDLVAIDTNRDNCVTFIDIFVSENTKETPINRFDVESRMLRELVEMPEWTDMPIRYDRITIVPIVDRALIKHHIDAIGMIRCEDD